MKKTLVATAILGILLAGSPAFAQGAAKPMEKPASGLRAEVLRSIQEAEEKLVALAEAIPAEKYAWRPGEGVRSTGEVFAHVASANYFLPTFLGRNIPEGVNPRGFEKDGADKAKIVPLLKQSFENARQGVQNLADADLEKAVELFGRQSNTREVALLIATHSHEHLGQAIAYARMNGVVPPWSRGE